MTNEGGPEVREERVPPIRPCREFYLLGLSTRADMPGVGSIRLGLETHLHPVERWVEHAVPEPKARKRAVDDLGDWRLWSLLERHFCGCAGDERQAARLDKARAVVFTLDRWLVRTVLEAPR